MEKKSVHEKISEQSRSIRELIYEVLKEGILNGNYEPGEHLRERELATEFNVSTTPIKEALRQLGKEGLVVTKARKGTFVSNSVMSSVEEITLARAALEGVAAGLAALKRTEKELEELQSYIQRMKEYTEKKDSEKLEKINGLFHDAIRNAAKNDYISHQIESVRSFDQFIRKKALSDKEEHTRAFEEHLLIFTNIKEMNGEGAENAMRSHINRTKKFALGKTTGDSNNVPIAFSETRT
ncbi:GntR family transcriptional regulator [Bacillus sp. SG-1]|uniref:GntR family transcriptional regulator n=1 Tax=Bacillus sp. SG-1 TaxID=161544 RepID=UPI0001543A77|nr:GntR family transcriptional regulator [Bacillus sp. SG-1]EDL65585.1 transcriptional regulator [Bacillus sp. SG-1]